ncbi:putative glycosyl hydrolase [Streptomyces sp. Tu6071]|uniref:Glycoside hydrolase family 43 protein n=1 Tax=Streptomyces evansiae TaxID=3075535 RepID=A0ABD5E363_9ACTN|nr:MULTISPECIES: glycoside hydrolase family 43 protein [unclassified Streptomyces]EGJ73017.1 putative glycosyl hydrolase [Streptomyces sp. Tu6071]MDT0415093.1 glycoside hydrolase family 43 protein [Streptomyces sp. DSM 41982]
MTTVSPTGPASPAPGAHERATISNPVLAGFHPDPSLLRVGADYYLATSTFEWLPGVTLHHSRDLVHWRTLGGVLGEERLLDLVGVPDSGGVWAPCLSYADGTYYLVYSDVKSLAGAYKDVHNHVVTAPAITGPWSDPAPAPGHGFDASLFHDDPAPDGDGRSWLLWLEWDHRPGHDPFGGILLQEWDRTARAVTGPAHRIFSGTARGRTEGPHLYRREGWYYLVTAEGGTGWEHAVTVARARAVTGPYEADPAGPLLSSWEDPGLALQKAGHGSLVETPAGEWYLAHLAARPFGARGACVLGRETALQRVEWTAGGWPRVVGEAGTGRPALRVAAPLGTGAAGTGLASGPVPAREAAWGPGLLPGPEWMTLRRHADSSWAGPGAAPGSVRLRGGESLSSRHRQSLVARRQQHARFTFTATVDHEPGSPRRSAGLAHVYNTQLWHYAHVTADGAGARVLCLAVCDRGRYAELAGAALPDADPVRLRLTGDGPLARFAWEDAGVWRALGPALDTTRLSDEYATVGGPDGHFSSWGFTGAFLGLSAQDLTGEGRAAEFSRVRYEGGVARGPAGEGPGASD